MTQTATPAPGSQPDTERLFLVPVHADLERPAELTLLLQAQIRPDMVIWWLGDRVLGICTQRRMLADWLLHPRGVFGLDALALSVAESGGLVFAIEGIPYFTQPTTERELRRVMCSDIQT